MDRRLRIFGNLLVYLLFTSFLAFAAPTPWHEKLDPSHAGAFRTADRIWAEHTTLAVVHHLLLITMSALRMLSTAARRVPSMSAAQLGRRGYAEAADKIKLSLVLPHQVRVTTHDTQHEY
jgi:hypothetical protein